MTKKLLIVILSMSLFQPTALAQLLLQGRIEHSECLPPIDHRFRTGLLFSKSNLPKLIPGNKWYRVPMWAVGTWKTEKQTTYFEYSFETDDEESNRTTINARSEGTVGWQQDAQGKIWEYQDAPYVQIVEGDYSYTVQLIQMNEPILVSENKIIRRFRSTDIDVSTFTNRILSVQQVESIQTYTPMVDGYIQCVASIKSFDRDGNPAKLSQVVAAEVRTASFEPWKYYRGQDMYFLFTNFLHAHNLVKLIPPKPVLSSDRTKSQADDYLQQLVRLQLSPVLPIAPSNPW